MAHQASLYERFVTRRCAVALLFASVASVVWVEPQDLHAQSRVAPAPTRADGVIIRIHGEITGTTVESLERRIEAARKFGPEVLIFELNTQGGRLDSAIEICDLTSMVVSSPITRSAWGTA